MTTTVLLSAIEYDGTVRAETASRCIFNDTKRGAYPTAVRQTKTGIALSGRDDLNASMGSVSMDGCLHSRNEHLQEDEAQLSTHACLPLRRQHLIVLILVLFDDCLLLLGITIHLPANLLSRLVPTTLDSAFEHV